MNAHAALDRAALIHPAKTEWPGADSAGVSPQICVNSACLRLPSGRFCVNLPVLGRRCVNIPNLGSWRVRCCTRFGWPPVRCGIARC